MDARLARAKKFVAHLSSLAFLSCWNNSLVKHVHVFVWVRCLMVFVHTRLAHLGLMRVFMFSRTNTRTCARAFTLTHTHSPTPTTLSHALSHTYLLTHTHSCTRYEADLRAARRMDLSAIAALKFVSVGGNDREGRRVVTLAAKAIPANADVQALMMCVHCACAVHQCTTFARDGRAVHRCLKLRATCFARYDY
jgi:hypothetical protein